MFLSFRAKLFAISVALLGAFIAISGLYLHHTLQDWTTSRIETDLQSRAQLVANTLDFHSPDDTTVALVDALDDDSDQRITVLDIDGTVVADSDLSIQEVADLDSHADRPEFVAALDDGIGRALRYSDSMGQQMLYVAIAPQASDRVTRVSVPLDDVDDALNHLRLLLVIGGIFGLAIAVLMSSVASKLMSKTLRNVVGRARSTKGQSSSKSLRDLTRTLDETMQTLTIERDRFYAVIDGMSEGVIATDEQSTITLSNQAARRLLDTNDAPNGKALSEVLPAHIADDLFCVVDGERDAGAEFEVGASPKRRIHVQATSRPDSDGIIVVIHDVTTLRHLERMRRDFVANVSHELRTPVTVIQANAETLLNGAIDDPEHARSFTEAIHRNAARLSRLIADLLDISRIEAGEMEFALQALPVSDAIGHAAEAVEYKRNEAQPDIDINVAPELQVVADIGALDQVLVNLLENALKYADQSTAIVVRAHRDGDCAVIEVCDDGPGVAKEHRDRLFERFYRVDSGRSTEMGGTGLGLSIVKHLVTALDGNVGYRPGDGGGSVFWFSLPIADR